MVSGDVCTEVPPDALDLVFVRAVGRREMLDQSTLMLMQESLDSLCLMNHVVVQDEMNPTRPRVSPEQLLQQGQKEVGVLPGTTHENQVVPHSRPIKMLARRRSPLKHMILARKRHPGPLDLDPALSLRDGS